jgi:3-deoxy-D-manno-octulosonic-acid transferase
MLWRSLSLYNLLLPLWMLFMLPVALVKMKRRGGRWRDFGQRFAFYPADRQAAVDALPARKRLWVHAVSVGEVGVARKLIQTLLRMSPEVGVVLTTTTPTGYGLAQEAEHAGKGRVVALYSPVDLPGVGGRALRRLKPQRVVLVEAEVWPNLMASAKAAQIPVSLVNARLSPRSARRYEKFRRLVGPIFALLDQVMVQELEDVQRWQRIGAQAERVLHTGSVKYDPQGSAPSAEQVSRFGELLEALGLHGRPLLLAASTHDGEELALARVFAELRLSHPDLGLLLVPRHFERGAAVEAELHEVGIPALRRSLEPTGSTDVLIIDSTGELKAWQQWATIVIIGKSFLAEGGQNPVEAILAGKPVVTGPHMENFLPLMDLLRRHDAVTEVAGMESLAPALRNLLGDLSIGRAQAKRGWAALSRHNGATERTAEALLQRA